MSSFSSVSEPKANVAGAIKQALPIVNTVLDKGCQIGNVVGAIYPKVQPIANGVCAAHGVTNVLVGKKN
jgi:hypothetical protein